MPWIGTDKFRRATPGIRPVGHAMAKEWSEIAEEIMRDAYARDQGGRRAR
jgi:hypothetical protein